MDARFDLNVEIADPLKPYCQLAVTRLRYLFQDVSFAIEEHGISAKVPPEKDANDLAREISYAVYREKIFADTLTMRRSFMNGVMRR